MEQPQRDENLPTWLQDLTDEQQQRAANPSTRGVSPVLVTLIIIALALVGIIGYTFYQQQQGTVTEGPAPAFEVVAWDFDGLAMPGETLNLESLSGKTVVINFWASWCIPCQEEAPYFERTWQDYRDQDVVFIGVNTDDTDVTAREYIQKYGLTYPHGPDRGERMEESFGFTGIPETFIINADGEIMRHFISSPGEGELRRAIEDALQG